MATQEREMARLRALIAIDDARGDQLSELAQSRLASPIGSGLVEAARSLQATQWERFRRRRYFELVDVLLRRIEKPGRSGQLNELEAQFLGHALCLIRFGVPGNLTWYLHFSEIVDEGVVPEQRLRLALRTDAADTDTLGRVHLRVRGMGARIFWTAGVAALVAMAVVANMGQVDAGARVLPSWLLIAANIAMPGVLAGLWFQGPRRWASEKVLSGTGLWDSPSVQPGVPASH